MSRIRSVHPGLWTDERFASVSPIARLLFIGIWNECDDAGSFEWSPIKLKMRILPADSADATELLAELDAAGMVMSYEIDGRKLGAVRNFTAFQRPKKPNSLYSQTDEVRKFCGVKPPPVPNQFPTGGEIAPQMEEEGGRRVVPFDKSNGAVDPEKFMFDTGISMLVAQGKTEPAARSLLGKWKRDHGAGEVIEMLGTAQRMAIVDIPSWAEGRWRTSSKREPVIGI